MDSLTHLVLGAALGEIIAGKKAGKKAMFIGALANTVPDFDVLGEAFFSSAHQLMFHRGITHSFLFAVLVPLTLAWICNAFSKKGSLAFKDWYLLFFTGFLSHELLDSLTAYGTAWYLPFSEWRVAFNTIFVADPFYTVPFLILMLVAVFTKAGHKRRIRLSYAGILISTFYLLITISNSMHVHKIAKDSLAKSHIEYENVYVTPTPLNNLLWMIYTREPDGTHIGYYSLLDENKDVRFRKKYRNDSLLIPFKDNEDLKVLKQFSVGNYLITKESNEVYFNDIRFGEVSGWDLSDTSFVFKYKVSGNELNKRTFSRANFKTTYKQYVFSLCNRARGI